MRQVDIDRRVLGALRCVDVNTRLPIDRPLRIDAPGLVFRRNRMGDFVITRAPGPFFITGNPEPVDLDAHTHQFTDAPAAPAVGSVSIDLRIAEDSHPALPFDELLQQSVSIRYLPRSFSIALPRDPAPDNIDSSDSLFQPMEVGLHPSLVIS
jgi:hypothetical protein